MQALIFNSGRGTRLGELTRQTPKGMVRLSDGEAIFERQLRILHTCGIDEFVVTTGPFAEQLVAAAAPYVADGCTFTFVPNSFYDTTNYIYSMYRARPYLHAESFLVLHGDLVFDAAYVRDLLDAPAPALAAVNAAAPLPDKDFKARVIDGELREVSVHIFDADCVAFQPLYKLNATSMRLWLGRVDAFVERGETSVYAEDAANEIFAQMHVAAFSYEGHFVAEVDTPEDLVAVSKLIRRNYASR